MKCCSKCKQEKPITEFHKDKYRPDGFTTQCKECRLKKKYEYDKTSAAKAKAAQHRKTAKYKVRRSRYQKTEKAKATRRRYEKTHRAVLNAGQTVHRAIKVGKLKPVYECKCFYCEEKAQEYHHYLGYEKKHWLSVLPLCRSCHIKRHYR